MFVDIKQVLILLELMVRERLSVVKLWQVFCSNSKSERLKYIKKAEWIILSHKKLSSSKTPIEEVWAIFDACYVRRNLERNSLPTFSVLLRKAEDTLVHYYLYEWQWNGLSLDDLNYIQEKCCMFSEEVEKIQDKIENFISEHSSRESQESLNNIETVITETNRYKESVARTRQRINIELSSTKMEIQPKIQPYEYK